MEPWRSPDYSNAAIAAEFRRYRNILEMTQEEFAAHLGITRQSYQRLESGDRSLTVQQFFDYTHSVAELMGREITVLGLAIARF